MRRTTEKLKSRQGRNELLDRAIFGVWIASWAVIALALFTPLFGMTALGFALTSGLISSTIAIPRLLDWFHSPTLREQIGKVSVPEVVADEREDLKYGIIPRSFYMAAAFILILIVYAIQLLRYGKLWNAYWETWHIGYVHVGIYALITFIMLRYVAKSTDWYHAKHERASTGLILFLVFGLVFSVWAGPYFTEPVSDNGLTQSQLDQIARSDNGHGYSYGHTRAYYYYNYWFDSGPSSSVAPSTAPSSAGSPTMKLDSCKGSNCGKGLLALLVIALIIVAIFGSAIVAQFWVFIIPQLLLILYLLVKHELKRDRSWERRAQFRGVRG